MDPLTQPLRPATPEAVPLLTYLYVLGIAIAGGLVSYRAKVVARHPRTWSIMELIGESFVAAFAGLLVFWSCQHIAAPPFLTAICTGLAGHMGGRAIQGLEEQLKRKGNL